MKRADMLLGLALAGWIVPGAVMAAEEEIPMAETPAINSKTGLPVNNKPSSAKAVVNDANVLPTNAYESSGIPVAEGRDVRPIRMGGINLYPRLGLLTGYDSNVTQAPSGAKRDSYFTTLRPTLVAEALYRADSYRLGYLGDYVHYNSVPGNSVTNHDLLFQAQNVFTARSSLVWGVSWLDRHDQVGSTDRSINATEADHHRDWLVNGTYRYGANGAKGRVEIDAGVGGKRYLNNRATTESADVANTNLGARFLYRVAPRTQLLTELRNTTYDYKLDTQQLDNTEQRYLVGAVWEASAATTGTVKLGQQVKNYKTGTRKDYSGATWEAGVRWEPLTYSSFDLVSGRAATDPSSLGGDSVVTYNTSLAWNHSWKPYLRTAATVGRQRSKYSGTSRVDGITSIAGSVIYDFRSWLSLGLELQHTKRNSTLDQFDYARNLIMFKFDMAY